MAEMSDDDVFVTSEVYGEDMISTGTGKSCWYYTKKFLLAIVVIALIAPLVIQLEHRRSTCFYLQAIESWSRSEWCTRCGAWTKQRRLRKLDCTADGWLDCRTYQGEQHAPDIPAAVQQPEPEAHKKLVQAAPAKLEGT